MRRTGGCDGVEESKQGRRELVTVAWDGRVSLGRLDRSAGRGESELDGKVVVKMEGGALGNSRDGMENVGW